MTDVPWKHAVELVSRFARDDVVLTLVKDGDHRLSRPEDIERCWRRWRSSSDRRALYSAVLSSSTVSKSAGRMTSSDSQSSE